ncbi:MAG: GMC family oxidoreductase N-terminal domain-containing protein [Rhodobacteraceae bacterium]|nr:GMC family oxidoreductase N-terminal domain-containing protein [Paracoccaceae bacterium]
MQFDPPHIPDAFDIIIVGSGSGGAVVARRLVDAGHDVLVLEAGGDGRGDPLLEDPTRWMQIGTSRHDWGHHYAAHPATLNRRIPIPRGRVLGGCGTTNAMMWYRGHRADYDRWRDLGCTGWGFAECLPAFRACEDWGGDDCTLRGQGGPLKVAPPATPHPLALALIEAADQAGLPVLSDANGPSNEGAALSNFNIHAGRRFGPVEGYLAPVFDAPNLTIALNTRALAIQWHGDRAAAVQIARAGEVQLISARHAIVLAAGAFETPRLLMLSGVGSAQDLRALGVAQLIDAPELGQNLQDHPLVRAVNFRARHTLPPPRDNGGGAILNWRSDAGLSRPDLHAFPIAGRSGGPDVVQRYGLPETGVFAIAPGLMGSKSRGYMRLTSADPDAPLHLAPGFLTHPDDMTALLRGLDFVLDLASRPALRALTDGPLAPLAQSDQAARAEFVRLACSTFFHPCGTARMGSDTGAVTTPDLRLRGARGLWVADASVIPEIPSCNTHAVVTMIGERAATFIKDAL